MAKYLQKISYTQTGVQGLLKDGGSKRREVARKAAEGLGATLEGFYFAFGDQDAYVIADAPDDESIAAIALVVTAGGGAVTETVKLLEPEQIDAATQKAVSYEPPGR